MQLSCIPLLQKKCEWDRYWVWILLTDPHLRKTSSILKVVLAAPKDYESFKFFIDLWNFKTKATKVLSVRSLPIRKSLFGASIYWHVVSEMNQFAWLSPVNFDVVSGNKNTFTAEDDLFKRQINLDRCGPRPLRNVWDFANVDPLLFSLYITFKVLNKGKMRIKVDIFLIRLHTEKNVL